MHTDIVWHEYSRLYVIWKTEVAKLNAHIAKTGRGVTSAISEAQTFEWIYIYTIFTRDAIISENRWQIASMSIDMKKLFMVSHATFHFLHALVYFNTLRPRQNGCHFADDIFKCIFLNENIWTLIKISLKFVPRVPLTVIQHWFR